MAISGFADLPRCPGRLQQHATSNNVVLVLGDKGPAREGMIVDLS